MCPLDLSSTLNNRSYVRSWFLFWGNFLTVLVSHISWPLFRYGHFSGINRKVQLKAINDKRNYDMNSKFKFKGRNKKSQTSITNSKALLLILKWGGELTPMGKKQAEDLGRAFRCLYPGGQGTLFQNMRFFFQKMSSCLPVRRSNVFWSGDPQEAVEWVYARQVTLT